MSGILHLNFGFSINTVYIDTPYSRNYDVRVKTDINEPFNSLNPKIKEAFSAGIKREKIEEFSNRNRKQEVVENLKKSQNRIKEFTKSQRLRELSELDVLKDIKYVSFNDVSLENCLTYIEKNGDLKDRKIVLPGIYSLVDDFTEIFEKFGKFDNIYVCMGDTREYISLTDIRKILEKIDSVVDTVKGYNFSPLEKLIYIYDITRDRGSIIDIDDKTKEESAKIYNSIFSGNTRGSDYTNVFNILCKKLGIKCSTYVLYAWHKTHTRNMIHLKDEKYGLDGFYFVDAAYDKKKDNNSFLKSYLYFLKTYSFFKNVDKDIEREYTSVNPDNLLRRYDLAIGNPSSLIDDNFSAEAFFATIRTIQTFTGSENLCLLDLVNQNVDKLQEIRENLKNNIPLFYREIPNSTFIKALYNVRKVQHYQNPEKYELKSKELKTISQKSGFKLSDNQDSTNDTKQINKDIKNITNIGISKDLAQVKLTRTLNLILEKEKDMQ